MFKNLVSIMFRPNVTISRLLEERKFGRSWGATWLLVGLNVLVMFIFAIFLFRFIEAHREPEMYLPGEINTRLVLWGVFAVVMIGGAVQAILYFGLGRVLFSWIVRLGLRISAGHNVPVDPYERAEKGRQLAMIHPYTAWISHWPKLLAMLFSPLLFLMPGVVALLDESVYGMQANQYAEMQFVIVFLILALVWGLVQLGMRIYMVVVRTIAIQKIYGIGAGQAFWGPFLIYFLIYFAGFLLYFTLLMLSAMFGGASLEPGDVTDYNSHLGI